MIAAAKAAFPLPPVPSVGILERLYPLDHLDFEPTCQHLDDKDNPACDKPARWQGRASCCGFVIIRCHHHKNELLEWEVLAQIDGGPLLHDLGPNACGRVTARIDWTPITKAGAE